MSLRWSVLALVLAAGCAPPSADQATTAPEPPAVERTLPSTAEVRSGGWIEAVGGAHAAADAAQDATAIEEAIRLLAEAFARGPSLPDATPVRQDLAGRIAGLALRMDRPEEAARWARDGLALPGPPSVFTVHLHLEAARAADALGDAPAAAAAREAARRLNTSLRAR